MGLLGPSPASGPVIHIHCNSNDESSLSGSASKKPKKKKLLNKPLLALLAGGGFVGWNNLSENHQETTLEAMGGVRDKVGAVSGDLLEDGKSFTADFFDGAFEETSEDLNKAVTVEEGDNFLSLASAYYGEKITSSDLDILVPLCEGVTNPDKIFPGDVITFPDRELF